MFPRALLPLFGLAIFFLHKPATLQAALYADVQTTLGTFTIDLDYTNAPITVGNFVGLATGELAWVDPDSGRVREDTPYFEGILFHRVIAGFMNQGGDPTGTGSGGPGYRFTDELATSDFSLPYRVAMANSGPQTNGSQFFVTAPETSTPTRLNGVHTVFGFIPEDDGDIEDGIVDGSRAVVDTINGVATDGDARPLASVEILSVTIRRTDAGAQAFEIPKADLPAVAPMGVDFNPTEIGMELGFTQNPGTTFQIGVSGDLDTWAIDSRYISSDRSALNAYTPTPSSLEPTAQFYTPVQVTSPNAVTFPDSMANRVFTTAVGSSETMTFSFDSDGETGNFEYTSPNQETPITGNFSLYSSEIPYAADAYGGRLILQLENFNPYIWAFNRMGQDNWDAGHINGRHNLTAYYIDGSSRPFPGTFSLSR